ncbi:hypothetical protein PR048_012599 [Dryococelus australis]|uniref:Uncharacterized protein n=1 Tax=Dryococelus australis TaxID=614101 RepID=A0ABQ9HR91_9NEOP|nr:hypothetical protein PR048_012599 [Dryococelus australis]
MADKTKLSSSVTMETCMCEGILSDSCDVYRTDDSVKDPDYIARDGYEVSSVKIGLQDNLNRQMDKAPEDVVHTFSDGEDEFCSRRKSRRKKGEEIANLYEHYITHYNMINKCDPVSEYKYRRIFTGNYNISLKPPKSDTCPTCDDLNNKTLATKDDEEKCQKYKVEKELNLRKAEKGQKNIQIQTVQASNDSKYHVITFDLQQALPPPPNISTRPDFYKRKMWTYNLGIHDCGIGVGHFYVCNETVANRGSEEILSCLKSILMATIFMETL